MAKLVGDVSSRIASLMRPTADLATELETLPSDYPVILEQEVRDRLNPNLHPWPDWWSNFNSGWNGMRYRFWAASLHEDNWRHSTARSVPAQTPERYRRESDLFGFVVNAHAVFECFVYGLGAVLARDATTLDTAPTNGQAIVTTSRVQLALNRLHGQSALAGSLAEVLRADEYRQLDTLRNVLVQRAAFPNDRATRDVHGHQGELWDQGLELSPETLPQLRRFVGTSTARLITDFAVLAAVPTARTSVGRIEQDELETSQEESRPDDAGLMTFVRRRLRLARNSGPGEPELVSAVDHDEPEPYDGDVVRELVEQVRVLEKGTETEPATDEPTTKGGSKLRPARRRRS